MSVGLLRRTALAFYRSRDRLRRAISDSHERAELRRFQQFFQALESKENIIFMFFTSGLLHWLARSLALTPQHVNVVLVGSDLHPEEVAWISANEARRPFHHVAERVDDNTVLGFIFETVEHNFGWLHVDCFVLNPEVFHDMLEIEDDVAFNCIWSNPRASGVTTLNSAFVVANHRVLERVRATGVEVSPCTYHYQGASLGRTITHRQLYSRVPTAKQIELLAQALPTDDSGLPRYPDGSDYFPVMVLYQLVANALGYRLHPKRNLVRDGSVTAEFYSNEIIHVNGVATYKRYKDAEGSVGHRFYPLLLQADYVVMKAMSGELPAPYRALQEELKDDIRYLGIKEEQATLNLANFLEMRGISPETSARILGKDV